jgi:2-amino-4-hydroxy-6-hydroxymethyldihydropteridine diphosphokinase
MPTAYIALGANLPSSAGPPEQTLARAAERLAESGHVTARSPLYSTKPVGLAEQPRFLNAVITLETDLTPRELLETLMAIEHENGRDRAASVANGPRTLDLDILLYGDFVLSEAGLDIPHPRIAERAFVLVPLNDIASALREPRSGATVSELLGALRKAAPQTIDHAILETQSDSWLAGVGHPARGSDPSPDPARAGADPDHG